MNTSLSVSGFLPPANLFRTGVAAILASLSLGAVAAPEPDPFPRETVTGQGQRSLELFVSMLTGTWKGTPDLYGPTDPTPTMLRLGRFWTGRSGEFWVYAEYARPDDESHPFRQRIYRIGESGGLIRMVVYRIPGDPARFAGEWRKARPFEALSPKDLTERKGCRIEIPPGMPIAFGGTTSGQDCAPESPGAAYETASILLSPGNLKYWERGFDAGGKQVTGSTEGALNFLRESDQPR